MNGIQLIYAKLRLPLFQILNKEIAAFGQR